MGKPVRMSATSRVEVALDVTETPLKTLVPVTGDEAVETGNPSLTFVSEDRPEGATAHHSGAPTPQHMQHSKIQWVSLGLAFVLGSFGCAYGSEIVPGDGDDASGGAGQGGRGILDTDTGTGTDTDVNVGGAATGTGSETGGAGASAGTDTATGTGTGTGTGSGTGTGTGAAVDCYAAMGLCTPMAPSCNAGESCDLGPNGFECFPPPNLAAEGQLCAAQGPYCQHGMGCPQGACARYCCSQADCVSGGTCTDVGNNISFCM